MAEQQISLLPFYQGWIPIRNCFSRLLSRCHSINCPYIARHISVRSGKTPLISLGRALAWSMEFWVKVYAFGQHLHKDPEESPFDRGLDLILP